MTTDILSREALQGQLDQIELWKAMYPSEGELVNDAETESFLAELRRYCEGDGCLSPIIPPSIFFQLSIDVGEDVASTIPLSIEVPLTGDTSTGEPAPCRLRVRQPDWLTKAQVAQLSSNMPEDDVLSAIEHVREQASIISSELQSQASAEVKTSSGPLVRVWFYFPSISTRQKRDDIVNFAPSYAITGFLLAGKPGILCLEGGAQDIDDYMHYIKTVSWGDIPSQHKKVTERYRENEVTSTFLGMEEITDSLEKRGERSNRGDMKALEKWLGEKGLGNAFSKVLM